MKFEMEYFDVREIRFSEKTRFSDGLLSIDKNELIRQLSSDDRIAVIDIELVRPGENARITNVLDIIEPRIKTGVESYFPGMLRWPGPSGEGVTRVLRGATVFEIGAAQGFIGGLVDMDGNGAPLTPYSKTHNVCLLTAPGAGTSLVEYGLALKQAGCKASVYLAAATKGVTPDEAQIFDLDLGKQETSLPRVGYLFQLHSHGDSREPFVYGDNSRHYYPTILHPNEILDGAIVCGHYNLSVAIKNYTYSLLNHPVVAGLYKRHGKELCFGGVVITPEPTSMTDIKRTSMMAANLLKNVLHVDGVILTKEGGGHTDVDLMQNCDECEKLGIRTVLVDNEWLGPDGAGEMPLLAGSDNADAMVSVGNIDAVVDLLPMGRIVGGRAMHDFPGPLDGQLRMPLRFLATAISQIGSNHLTTEGR